VTDYIPPELNGHKLDSITYNKRTILVSAYVYIIIKLNVESALHDFKTTPVSLCYDPPIPSVIIINIIERAIQGQYQ
jgi:hypothetical protein